MLIFSKGYVINITTLVFIVFITVTCASWGGTGYAEWVEVGPGGGGAGATARAVLAFSDSLGSARSTMRE